MVRGATLSALAVIVAGSILHFAWEWSDRSPLVGVFAAVNESTWEHLKLAFWPALGLGLVHREIYDAPRGWLVATALRCSIPPMGIVLLFYGYVAVAGGHQLAGDVAVFAVSVLVGEYAGHSVLEREFGPKARIAAGLLLVLLIAAFSVLTYWAPAFFLFEDPLSASSGAA